MREQTFTLPAGYLSDPRVPGTTRVLMACHALGGSEDREALADVTGLSAAKVRVYLRRLAKPVRNAPQALPHLNAKGKINPPAVGADQRQVLARRLGDLKAENYPEVHIHGKALAPLWEGRFSVLRDLEDDTAKDFWRFFRWRRKRIKTKALQALDARLADQVALIALARKVAADPGILDEIRDLAPGLGHHLQNLTEKDLGPVLRQVEQVKSALRRWDSDPEIHTIREQVIHMALGASSTVS